MTFNINILNIVIVAIVVVLAILLFLVVTKRRRSNEYNNNKILNTITRARVDNIIIPDGIGGLLEIKQLRLIDQGILIVETYPMSGDLFGADEIDHWTQLVKGRSYKFANPLRHITTSRHAVMTLVPDVAVFYRVIFNADARFPKGKPDGVSIISSLAADIAPIQSQLKQIDLTQQAWDKLLRIARKNGHAAKDEEKI